MRHTPPAICLGHASDEANTGGARKDAKNAMTACCRWQGGGMSHRSSLTIKEAAFAIGISYSKAYRMVQSGVLVRGATGLCPDGVRTVAAAVACSEEELALRYQAIDLMLQGRLESPRPATRWAVPPPIMDLPQILAFRLIQRAAGESARPCVSPFKPIVRATD